MLKLSVRLLLFVTLVLAAFHAPGFAQVGVIMQISPNANVDVVAEHIHGGRADFIPGTTQYLFSTPSAPPDSQSPDDDSKWRERNRAATLMTGARPKYVTANPAAAADWYKTQPCMSLIHLSAAWTYSTGRTVVVADLNSQVDYSHPALVGHLTSGYDFVLDKPHGVSALNDESSAGYLDDESSAGYLDQSSTSYLLASGATLMDESSAGYLDGLNPAYAHGTLTAGIIAAIAPDAMIMPLRVFDENGQSSLFMIAKAIRYAVNHGATVINLSFGVDRDSAVLRSAINFAIANNVTITASAGNSNSSVPQYPAAYPGVLSVAATDLSDVKALFSNYGGAIDIDAPGVNVISAFPGNLYAIVSGTSFSAPAIAGTAALLQAQNSTTPVPLRVNAGGVNINAQNPAYAGQLGYGRIDILRALQSP
jgi:subtilisin family serine protease